MSSFHPRLLGGAVLGFITGALALKLGLGGASSVLLGWNIGALGYLAAIWRLYLTASEGEVRARAANQDEPPIIIATLAALAIVASLVGVYAALAASRGGGAQGGTLVTALSGLTLVSTWFVVQSLFVAHYAHRHFQAIANRGENAGFLFPGDPLKGYLDFAYLAICVGATAQVSDPGVQSRPLRNLVTAHAVTAFFYNTAVLALGVNILSGLLGH
jgi:uncharacterized membrane protein